YLDLQQRMHVLSILKKLAKETGKIILLVLHEIPLIQLCCDKVILLTQDGNKKIGSCSEIINRETLGTMLPKELLDSCGF
ncbi:MAG: hypothetical protein KKH06_03485, partial [Gammaproteobacteria bacterium]|nr:hypothetical protein [Gammaproteobacteria bacterium]